MGRNDKPPKEPSRAEGNDNFNIPNYQVGWILDKLESSKKFKRVKTFFAVIGFLAILIGIPAGAIALYRYPYDLNNITRYQEEVRENRRKADKSKNYLSLYEEEEKEFFEKHEVHYMLFLDESGSTAELTYNKEKTYRQVKELLRSTLGLREEEYENVSLKRLIFSYMIHRLCLKIEPQFQDNNFIINDYFTKENPRIVAEESLRQSCVNGRRKWLMPLERKDSNVDTDLYSFFLRLRNRIKAINEKKGDSNKSKFFVVTIMSDFIDDDVNARKGAEEISELLNMDLGDSKMQLNLVVLPTKEKEEKKRNKVKPLLYKIKKRFGSPMNNSNSKRVSIFGTLDKRVTAYNNNWVKEENTNFLNWIELINTPFVEPGTVARDSAQIVNLVRDELWIYPKGKVINDGKTNKRANRFNNKFAIVLEENSSLNKQADASVLFSIQTIQGDTNQSNQGVMLNREVDCRANIKFCFLDPNECIVIEKSSSSNPSKASNLYLQIYKKGNITKLEIPIKVD